MTTATAIRSAAVCASPGCTRAPNAIVKFVFGPNADGLVHYCGSDAVRFVLDGNAQIVKIW